MLGGESASAGMKQREHCGRRQDRALASALKSCTALESVSDPSRRSLIASCGDARKRRDQGQISPLVATFTVSFCEGARDTSAKPCLATSRLLDVVHELSRVLLPACKEDFTKRTRACAGEVSANSEGEARSDRAADK